MGDLMTVAVERGIALPAKEARETAIKFAQAFLTGKGFSQAEVGAFVDYCAVQGLNPFQREAHLIAYGQGDKRTMAVVTGYPVYLRRAEVHPHYKGYTYREVWRDKNGELLPPELRCGIVEVKRDDIELPAHECWFEEVCQTKPVYENGQRTNKVEPREQWATRPRYMLKKCAIAQALRLAFPDWMGPLTYTNEELGGHDLSGALDNTGTIPGGDGEGEADPAPDDRRAAGSKLAHVCKQAKSAGLFDPDDVTTFQNLAKTHEDAGPVLALIAEAEGLRDARKAHRQATPAEGLRHAIRTAAAKLTPIRAGELETDLKARGDDRAMLRSMLADVLDEAALRQGTLDV